MADDYLEISAKRIKLSTSTEVEQVSFKDASTQTDDRDHRASENIIIGTFFPKPDASTETDVYDSIVMNFLPNVIKESELSEILSPFGRILEIDFTSNLNSNFDNFARIKFSSEHETMSVWSVAQAGALQYKGIKLLVARVAKERAPINEMDKNILKKIFSYIYNCTDRLKLDEVCKLWRDVGKEWKDVVTLTSDYPMFVDTLKKLKIVLPRCRGSVKHVVLDELHDDEAYEFFLTIAKNCTGIKTMRAEMPFENSWEGLQAIVNNNRGLLRISVGDIDDNLNLKEKLRHWPAKMLEIHIAAYNPTNDNCIDLTKFCSLLAFGLYHSSVSEKNMRGLEALKNLKSLYLDDSNIPSSYLSLLTGSQTLEHLSLYKVDIDDYLLSGILGKHTNLKWLNIGGMEKITDLSFRRLERLKKLSTLLMKNLKQIRGSGIHKLRSLQCLDIGGCQKIDKWEICRLIDTAPSALHTINVEGLEESAILHILYSAEVSSFLERCHPQLAIHPGSQAAESWNAPKHQRGQWKVLSKKSANLDYYFPGWYETAEGEIEQ